MYLPLPGSPPVRRPSQRTGGRFLGRDRVSKTEETEVPRNDESKSTRTSFAVWGQKVSASTRFTGWVLGC